MSKYLTKAWRLPKALGLSCLVLAMQQLSVLAKPTKASWGLMPKQACYVEDSYGRIIDLTALCIPDLNQTSLIYPEDFVHRLMADKKCVDCDLRRLGLSGVFLAGANLQGADLQWSSLQDSNLRNANLSGANLTDANLRGTILAGANLAGANLTGAALIGADLAGANLAGTIMPDGTTHR